MSANPTPCMCGRCPAWRPAPRSQGIPGWTPDPARTRARRPPFGSVRKITRVGAACIRLVELGYRDRVVYTVESLDRDGYLVQQHRLSDYDRALIVYSALAAGTPLTP